MEREGDNTEPKDHAGTLAFSCGRLEPDHGCFCSLPSELSPWSYSRTLDKNLQKQKDELRVQILVSIFCTFFSPLINSLVPINSIKYHPKSLILQVKT